MKEEYVGGDEEHFCVFFIIFMIVSYVSDCAYARYFLCMCENEMEIDKSLTVDK
jgi:hypothetical protein